MFSCINTLNISTGTQTSAQRNINTFTTKQGQRRCGSRVSPTPVLLLWLSSSHLASHSVVGVKLWLDVADAPQQLPQHCFSVTTVTVLDASHALHRVPIYLHCTVAMGTKSLRGGGGS